MVTFTDSPSPRWYLSQVGSMGPRLPLSSALHPVLLAFGRKCPYWLVAAVTGDVVRPLGHGFRTQEPVSEAEVAELGTWFGLAGTAFDLQQAESLDPVRAALAENIRDSRPGMVLCRPEGRGWWFPLIGHDQGCRHILARSWGQRYDRYTPVALETFRGVSGIRLCLFSSVAPAESDAVLARKALERIRAAARGRSEAGPQESPTVSAHQSMAQALENLSGSEANDPDIVYTVSANVECASNAKREAQAFFAAAVRWLPDEADPLEKAAWHYGRLSLLFGPAARDFGQMKTAGVMLKRPEKRAALAQVYRVAAKMEARALHVLQSGPNLTQEETGGREA